MPIKPWEAGALRDVVLDELGIAGAAAEEIVAAPNRRKQKSLLVAGAGAAAFSLFIGAAASLLDIRLEAGPWVLWTALTLASWLLHYVIVGSPRFRCPRFDPHYIRIPVLTQALCLCGVVFVAPELRFGAFLAWQSGVLTLGGKATFGEALGLAGGMSVIYLAAAELARSSGRLAAPLSEDLLVVLFFLCCSVYAAFELQRVYRTRIERRDFQRELQRLARSDALTGLLNRRGFLEIVEREYERARRGGDVFALAILDVDDFKNYNDTLGHAVGDEVLCDVARVLCAHKRRTDVVARWAGDEFIVMLAGTDLRNAGGVLDRLRRAIYEEVAYGVDRKGTGPVATSAGVAVCVPETSPPAQAIQLADEAMYRCKRLRREVADGAFVPSQG